jgi:hypothetical protein
MGGQKKSERPEQPTPVATPSRSRAVTAGLWVAALLFVLVPLGYALYTGHMWEDYFITFRYSRNLAQGNGLVFNKGERVHGFTSPLNVLLPALFDWLGGSRSYEMPLWGFRLVSIAAFAGAGLLLVNLLRKEPAGDGLSAWVFALLLLLDLKAVAFSVNGQETAFMLFFLALGFVAVYRGPADHWRLLGLSWAGLMWTRPDGCVYIAILSLVSLVFGTAPARRQWPGLAKAAAVCAVLYLPWFLTAWVYYGTPVPHTLVAKAIGTSNPVDGATLVKRVLKGVVDVAPLTPAPVYANLGGWPGWVDYFCLVLGVACAAYWLVPSGDRLGRMASLAYLLGCLYLSYYAATSYNGVPFPWYLPPVNLLGLVVLARAPLMLLAQPRAARLDQAGLAVGLAVVFLLSAYQVRVQQREIDSGLRIPIGLWLADNVGPSQTVYSEALGYFGFFSQRHILDWPGLVSPGVVEARRKGYNTPLAVIRVLMPDWVLLRPYELTAASRNEEFRRDYEVAKVFSAAPALRQYAALPGIDYLKIDETFVILKRKKGGGQSGPKDARP